MITDGGADGLRPRREPNQPFDTQDAGGKSIRFDGNWREDKMSEKDYMKAFSQADEAYVAALQALLAELKKGPDPAFLRFSFPATAPTRPESASGPLRRTAPCLRRVPRVLARPQERPLALTRRCEQRIVHRRHVIVSQVDDEQSIHRRRLRRVCLERLR